MLRIASTGTCLLCGASVTKRGVQKHLDACAPAHDLASGDQELVGRFRIAGVGSAVYWLDVEARLSATLSSLDNLLRRTWLECCGHLSMFEIGRVRFLPVGAGTLDPFGRRDSERSMSARTVRFCRWSILRGWECVGTPADDRRRRARLRMAGR